jgi:hypothetical protein
MVLGSKQYGKDEVIPALNWLSTCGEWTYISTILHLGSRWRWMVSFRSRSLYRRENPPVPFGLGTVGPLAGLDHVEEWKILPLTGTEHRVSSPWLILIRLRYPESRWDDKYIQKVSRQTSRGRLFKWGADRTVYNDLRGCVFGCVLALPDLM